MSGIIMPADFDPYHDRKKYHLAKLVDAKGRVSPLCAGERPRSINLKRELWTLKRDAVTCDKCIALLPTIEANP